jgi:hypothetical protein
LKSLFYILFLFVIFSCKKEVNNTGYEVIGVESPFVGAVDTFKIHTNTLSFDTSQTNNPSYLLLGVNNDPIFGKTDASFCSQLRLVTTSPNFGDLSSLKVDSVVLSMKYDDLYGVNKPLNFKVLRLSEDLINKTYFSNTQISDDGNDLVFNSKNLVTPRSKGSYFVNSLKDTIYDQITIRLKDQLGEEIIQKSVDLPSTFASIDNFNAWFKGIKVIAKNEIKLDNDGAIYYISSPPRFTIYYSQGGVNKTFYFELNQNALRVNLLNFENKDYEAGKCIGLKNVNYFAQSNRLRSFITIPSLSNISKNSVIHSGKLVLPYDKTLSVFYNPGYQVSVSIPNSITDNRLRIIGYGNIDTTNHVFVVDLKEHIQSLVTGKRLNLGFYISPKDFSTSVTRIKFLNEGNFIPKLYLKVSSFKQ